MTATSHSPRFVTGKILRHVVTMAGTGSIGLMAFFAVDLLNYFYISHLKNPTLTAAMAFASSLGFVLSAVSIGLAIGVGATIGRLVGARKRILARRTASAFAAFVLVLASILGVACAIFAPQLYTIVGTPGAAFEPTVSYLRISAPAFPLICLGMTLSSLLRAVGAAKNSMMATLVSAGCMAILDPVLIFGLHLGLQGAAVSMVCARASFVAASLFYLRGYRLLALPRLDDVLPSIKKVGHIAAPAIVTNLATPVGGLYVVHSMAKWGENAVSAQAVIDRCMPVAFAFVFALTGSVGPIIAQNMGARRLDRVRETFLWAMRLTFGCVLATWVVFFAAQNLFIRLFSVQGVGVDLVHLFCTWLVGSYIFMGLLFVSNTAFNNLGHPLYSTFFNWGRATLGTIPFVALGSYLFQAKGVMIGYALGSVVFGSLALAGAFRVINRLETRLETQEP